MTSVFIYVYMILLYHWHLEWQWRRFHDVEIQKFPSTKTFQSARFSVLGTRGTNFSQRRFVRNILKQILFTLFDNFRHFDQPLTTCALIIWASATVKNGPISDRYIDRLPSVVELQAIHKYSTFGNNRLTRTLIAIISNSISNRVFYLS